jgi:glycosyltransferase involved in cell wall biosynthesis
LRVLLVNKFLYPKGGDAISTLKTGELLSKKGHEVFYWGMKHPQNPSYLYGEYFVPEVDYNKESRIVQRLKMAFNIFYSFEAKSKIDRLIKVINPELAHLNNFYHQLSPSILDPIKKHGIPVVMTLHDYKLVCPSYSMLLNGRPCERCKNGKYCFCLLKKCVKNSYLKSFISTLEMYLHHKILHIYNKVDIFISPSIFLLEKIKEMGFKGKMVYLPNFVDIDKFKPFYRWEEESIVYAGRLSYEKGLNTLIDAVKGLKIELKIIGDGPLKKYLSAKVENEKIKNVRFLGYKTGEELRNEIKKSMFTILPSEWYENNPMIVIESFALGKPVVGAKIGGIPELVKDWDTGLTFESGNSKNLRDKIILMLKNKNKIIDMGKNGRELVERELNPELYYKNLMEIYKMAMGEIRR